MIIGLLCSISRANPSLVQYLGCLRCVAHGFETMPIWVEDEGGVIVSVVLRAEFRKPIIPATGSERGCAAVVYGRTVGRSETDMRTS